MVPGLPQKPLPGFARLDRDDEPAQPHLGALLLLPLLFLLFPGLGHVCL
jgi:hypothetical protein